MNTPFEQYFRDNFFQDEKDLERFMKSLGKPLKKTIRVNTNKITIKELKERLEKQNYILTPTFQENVFYIERNEKFDELERRLGFTLEHLLGYFYIQELGASSSVFYLADGKIDKSDYLILDMASSPGGKTTQLSEYYPKGFIVANEFDKNRTSQLIANIERMGSENIGVTGYNGQYLGRLTETFDKVLLDAPCSGEGIGFKSAEALKYWNIKNVKKIADLQKKLFEAGLNALKIGGEMLYSTCTMNKLENEGVVEEMLSRHPGSFEILFQRRFWPHVDETGGFFVCKIKKLKTIEYDFSKKEELPNKTIEKLSKNDDHMIDAFMKASGVDLSDLILLKYSNEIIGISKSISFQEIRNRIYFFKLGKRLGKIEHGRFIPSYHLGRDHATEKLVSYLMKDELELDNFLRGMEIGESLEGDFMNIIFNGTKIGIGEINDQGRLKNNFPKIWLRK